MHLGHTYSDAGCGTRHPFLSRPAFVLSTSSTSPSTPYGPFVANPTDGHGIKMKGAHFVAGSARNVELYICHDIVLHAESRWLRFSGFRCNTREFPATRDVRLSVPDWPFLLKIQESFYSQRLCTIRFIHDCTNTHISVDGVSNCVRASQREYDANVGYWQRNLIINLKSCLGVTFLSTKRKKQRY